MVELHQSREGSKRKDYAEFAQRLCIATEAFERREGKRLTRVALAAMISERACATTARYVGRWYRGLAVPRRSLQMMKLAEILHVGVAWLGYGEGQRELPSRGVYITREGFSFYDNTGAYIGEIRVEDPDNAKPVLKKCWELLDLVSPVRPALRLESCSFAV